MLLPEYCLRLVAFMQQPEKARIAVVQTPYSAFRGAPTRLERIAGATTDVQHIVHQGMTRFGATSWVGASAVLRKTALHDIMVEEAHEGFTVRRYIQNRTLTEDSESTLDLRLRGWQLHNCPERLSYSATPPDFGALCVQRERWANGGLIIMPKVVRMMWVRKRIGATFLEGSSGSRTSWACCGPASAW
ncbi:MAG: glycosyltransferase family 2 protein [Thermoleophilia bacterium]